MHEYVLIKLHNFNVLLPVSAQLTITPLLVFLQSSSTLIGVRGMQTGWTLKIRSLLRNIVYFAVDMSRPAYC